MLGYGEVCALLGGGGRSGHHIISVTNRRGGKIQTAMDSSRIDLSDEVEKFDPWVTCDVTGDHRISRNKHKNV